MPAPRRRTPALAALAALAALSVAAGVLGTGPAMAATGSRTVSYLGHRFQIPGTWTVTDLSAHPDTCVRFDQHTLYLGTPGADQNCPSDVGARTEALLVQPATSPSAARGTVDQPLGQQYLATAADVRVTGTYGSDKQLVQSILTRAGLPAQAPQTVAATAPRSLAATGAATSATAATVPASSTNFKGKGFDACAAPSSAAMSTWMTDSPYGAVGIYIGGATACSQPNLTASWVQHQSADGWHFVPIYVGPQGAQITSAASQGTKAADDAVAQAQSLGFGAGTPLYYDMEPYPSSDRGNVLGLLSAWTKELHAKGYKSGAYGSAAYVVADLVNSIGGSYPEPDVIYDAHYDGNATTSDPSYLPASAWSVHQRIHQYSENITQSYGGVSINIDQDYLDVSLAATPPTSNVLTWALSNDVTSHVNTIAKATYGNTPMVPVSGNWDGAGGDTPGAYDPANATFYLTNSFAGGVASTTIHFGNVGDKPVIGKWDGGSTSEIGVYRPSNFTFYLRHADGTVTSFALGSGGNWEPVAGDWTHKGYDTPGLFDPDTNEFYLVNSDHSGDADTTIHFGNAGDIPVAGAWDGSGANAGIGVYRPGDNTFYFLHADGTTSSIRYGDDGDAPVVGDWDGNGTDTQGLAQS